jgi:hypothetical protein
MNDNANDIVIGAEPILQFGCRYDDTDELTNTYLIAQDDEQAVDQSPLSPEKMALLTEYEKEIDDGLDGFLLVGQRLSEIKRQGLFRATHRSFDRYCLDRFGFGRIYAKRVIKASKCVENLKTVPIGTVCTPANEAQARIISNLSADDQVKVAKRTKKNIGDREPTTKDFEDAKSQVVAANAKKTEKTKAAEEQADEPSNVVQMLEPPVAPLVSRSFTSPAEFHKGIPLPSLKEMSETAKDLSNINWDPEKKPQREKLLLKLTKWLPLYASWEKAMVNNQQQQEVA